MVLSCSCAPFIHHVQFYVIRANIFYIGWPFAVAREWTKFVDTNVCAVDWSILSRQDYLIAAQLNTRLVGYYIAEFITQLVRNNISPDDISVAGHSLGGQIVGFVGQNLINRNITLGRLYGLNFFFVLVFVFEEKQLTEMDFISLYFIITALDPGAPYFTLPFVLPYGLILNQNNAKYIQLIQTSTIGTQRSGTANFVANGGIQQPGCYLPFLITTEGSTPSMFA